VVVDHQFQFSRKVLFNRSSDSRGGFVGLGEYQEVVGVAHEAQAAAL
jgi:hypothetical protein